MFDPTTLITTLLGYYLPIDDPTVRFNIALAIGSAVGILLMTILTKIWEIKPSFNHYNSVIISKDNIYWDRIVQYMYETYTESSGHAILRDVQGRQKIVLARFKTKYITDRSFYITLTDENIMFESKKGIDMINKYIENIISKTSANMDIITVYHMDVESVRDTFLTRNINWRRGQIFSNKTRANTIVSKHVESTFYGDLTTFDKSEHIYAERGQNYRRGYLLHGIPGSGKSTLWETVAKHYNAPVFKLDFGEINDHSELKRIMIKIVNYINPGQRHIILLEDIDSSAFIQDSIYYNRIGGHGRMSITSMFELFDENVHNRIIIMTANNVEKMKSFHLMAPLFRPGRIDREIKIDYCDDQQVSKIIDMYFKDDNITDPMKDITITPAELNKVIQLHPSKELTIQFLKKFKVFKNGAYIEELAAKFAKGDTIDEEIITKVATEVNVEKENSQIRDLPDVSDALKETDEYKELIELKKNANALEVDVGIHGLKVENETDMKIKQLMFQKAIDHFKKRRELFLKNAELIDHSIKSKGSSDNTITSLDQLVERLQF